MSAGRFLALVGSTPGLVAEDILTGRGLKIIFRGEHLLVATDRSMPFILLPWGKGVVLGTLYGRQAVKPDLDYDKETSTADLLQKIGRAVQQECRDRSRMPSSA
eukprot:TRINITY_DN6296_c0_g1_i7.p3 TRINITY_DN6296_c0_g1~~TRINITY_DN6296_c0_g1_i7.p3  ORF type:complete len:104 (-),score=11.14 TRINITY_DN6296_c0_g1_i7:32-343(-)